MHPFASQALGVDLPALRAAALPCPAVAVLDSGIDASHPDLQGRVERAWRAEKTESEEWVVTGNPVTANNDNFGHGTAVASVILRIAPAARPTDYCVLGKTSLGAAGMTLTALRHAIDSGHKLVNMSLAVSQKYRNELLDLMEYGFSKGCFIIASQRNAPIRDLGLPAAMSFTAGVNSVDALGLGQVAFNRNSPIEFAALGTDLPVAAAGGGYTTATGTSYATPVVTGICALLLSRWPDLELFELKTLLKNASFAHVLDGA